MTESISLEEPAGLVILADLGQDGTLVEELKGRFEEADVRCSVLNAAELKSDREASALVEVELSALAKSLSARRRVGVLGLGEPGELALLSGCTSRQVSFVVSVFGPLVRDELNEARPSQPLELTLNLDAPFLLVHATEDPQVTIEHVELLRTKLDAFFRNYEVAERKGPGMETLRPQSPGYNASAAAECVADVLRTTIPFVVDALD